MEDYTIHTVEIGRIEKIESNKFFYQYDNTEFRFILEKKDLNTGNLISKLFFPITLEGAIILKD